MDLFITEQQLTEIGLSELEANQLIAKLTEYLNKSNNHVQAWQLISQKLLAFQYPFFIHLFIFSTLFPHWRHFPEIAPAWQPSDEDIAKSNLFKLMTVIDVKDVKAFHQWSIDHYQAFWHLMSEKLAIHFSQPWYAICDLVKGAEQPIWFAGSKLNIVDSCFNKQPQKIAIVYQDQNLALKEMTFNEIDQYSNQIANSLVKQGLSPGDVIGIIMPMTWQAVAIYLGIIKMGAVVVSIADSFSSQEIEERLNIVNAKLIFTQEEITWAGKNLPLYDKVQIATTKPIVVIPQIETFSNKLRSIDMAWQDFLIENNQFNNYPADPMAPCHILFSSGTTSQPKAIVWNHTTAIKAASDAYLHQDLKPSDCITWPTNLGWMMGPWLIFAAFINGATLALYPDAPKDRAFGEFVQKAKVSVLGVVPTLVAVWRETQCMEDLDWRSIKLFSSTGECSNAEDMLYLMSLAGYKPVIEYCGGTEIGGAYLSSTILQNNYPALFSTPAMGTHIVILDEHGHLATEGEVAIIPPSIGLSTALLNADHHQVYYANMPSNDKAFILRRHGDQVKQLSNGYYSILGRTDDTMNLGGIKVSATEIERTLVGIPHILETAAIAVAPIGGGPQQLVIYAATSSVDKNTILQVMQDRLNRYLNPLFKIHDVILVATLPKTASNKIMRRTLRKEYLKK